MPIVVMQDMRRHAHEQGYAVAAFELHSLTVLEGILSAAERCRAPLILAVAEDHFEAEAFKRFLPAIETAARSADVPVAIQLHKGTSHASAVRAINAGCNALMLDTQQTSLRHNPALIREVVDTAHACGIPVEGGLHQAANLAEIKNQLAQTGLDFLLVSTDTVHGHRTGDTKFDFAKLQQINQALAIPLAIRAGADMSEDQCLRFIAHGVTKINFGTALYDAVNTQIRTNAEQGTGDYAKLIRGVYDIVSAEAEACLRLCQSAGQAATLLSLCTPWALVEHLIIYNVSGDEHDVDAMLAEGRRILSAIPGVREVITARAIKEDAQYRYSWLIRFCHPAVIDSYREHPLHVAFADKRFRPVAGDRISIDYLWQE